jgi:uncharacterized LabA/DUF88 family protein
MRKVAVFIDGSYLDHVLEPKRQGKRISYQKLVQAIVSKAGADREVVRVYYYHCLPYQDNPPTDEQRERFSKMQGFFRALQRTPRFEVRRGRLAYRGLDSTGKPIYEQKQVDLLLGVDVMLHAAKRTVDEIFLIAGDSDFVPAIHAVKSEGILAYLVHGENPHDDLLDEADERIEITSDIVNSSILPT